jgi:hypothetical protein
VFFKFS